MPTVIKLPTSGSNDPAIAGTDWINPSYITTSGGLWAEFTGSAGSNSVYLLATGFGFSLSAADTIVGITVNIIRYKTPDGGATICRDNSVKLHYGGMTGFTGNDKASASLWPESSGSASYGNAGDLWGLTPTYSDVNDSGFGVGLSAIWDTGSDPMATGTAYVDYIEIAIEYTTTDTGETHVQVQGVHLDPYYDFTATGDWYSDTPWYAILPGAVESIQWPPTVVEQSVWEMYDLAAGEWFSSLPMGDVFAPVDPLDYVPIADGYDEPSWLALAGDWWSFTVAPESFSDHSCDCGGLVVMVSSIAGTAAFASVLTDDDDESTPSVVSGTARIVSAACGTVTIILDCEC